ncbi:MAG TPA: SIMPL domain-containing protein, partial [Dehalococcoidia bacterium]|nr:SIMPL domain-containing protein [Dehalococcoidia bacterium]
ACTEETVIQQAQQPAGVTVTGEGRVSGSPDVAEVTLGVSHEAPGVAEARQRAAEAMNAMLDALKSNGVEEKDIQTTQFNIEPQYDYEDGRQRLRGYRVTNIVTAKIRDIDATGSVIDAAVTAGGDAAQVQSLRFTIDDPSELEHQARRLAMENAREKARVLADAGGVELGDVVSVSESVSGFPPPVPFARGVIEPPATGPTPIQPGELEIVVTVNVMYELR